MSKLENLVDHVILGTALASDGKKDFPDWFVLCVSRHAVFFAERTTDFGVILKLAVT